MSLSDYCFWNLKAGVGTSKDVHASTLKSYQKLLKSHLHDVIAGFSLSSLSQHKVSFYVLYQKEFTDFGECDSDGLAGCNYQTQGVTFFSNREEACWLLVSYRDLCSGTPSLARM